jgi:hypothetical protein
LGRAADDALADASSVSTLIFPAGSSCPVVSVGRHVTSLGQIVRARHTRHALVGDQHRGLLATSPELAQDVEGLGSGARAENPVPLAEPSSQISRDRGEGGRFVIDSDYYRSADAFVCAGGVGPLIVVRCTCVAVRHEGGPAVTG